MIKLLSKYKIMFLPILLIVVSFLFSINKNNSYDSLTPQENITWDTYKQEPKEVIEEIQEANVTQKEVPIYICGQVSKPGVYYVKSESLVCDIIEVAGGLTPDANAEGINLARPIKSNEQIYVPKEGEEIDKITNSYENIEDANKLVNVNDATIEELDTLPGIGKTRAQQIIDYRRSNGAFLVIEDIKNVPGIGEKIFESLKDFISIE